MNTSLRAALAKIHIDPAAADIAIRKALSMYLSSHGQPEVAEIIRGFPPFYEYKTAVENWRNALEYLPLSSEFNKIRRYIEDVIETMTDDADAPLKSSFLMKRPVFVESTMKKRNYRLTENIDSLDQMWGNYDPTLTDYAGPTASYDVTIAAPSESEIATKASKALRMLKKRGYRTAEHAKRVEARTASVTLTDSEIDSILATHKKSYRAHEKQLKGVMAEAADDKSADNFPNRFAILKRIADYGKYETSKVEHMSKNGKKYVVISVDSEDEDDMKKDLKKFGIYGNLDDKEYTEGRDGERVNFWFLVSGMAESVDTKRGWDTYR